MATPTTTHPVPTGQDAVEKLEAAETAHLASRLTRERNPRRVSRRLKRWLIPLVILLLGAVSYVVWRALRPVPVDVAVAAYQRVGPAARPILRLSGFVTYPRIVTVGAAARTPVAALDFEVGQRVRRGAVLVRFANDDLVAQRRAQQVVLEDAQATLTRIRNLHAAGAVAAVDLQRAETAVAASEASLAVIETQLAGTVVRAPFTGLVTQQLVEVGEIAARGVCLLADDSMTLVEVDVSQQDIARIGPQQPAIITLDAYPDVEYAARVHQIMPTADQAKNTVTVRVRVLEPDSLFVSQLSAKLFFVEKALAQNTPVRAVLAVEKTAVWQDGGAAYVWRIADGRVERRAVQTGEDLGALIEITDGLEVDDQVVAAPDAYSFEGGERVDPRLVS